MNDLQLELTRLIGRKETTYGCFTVDGAGRPHMIRWGTLNREKGVYHEKYDYDSEDQYKFKVKEIIGHPATLSDLHRWLNLNKFIWEQRGNDIKLFDPICELIDYESNKDLLYQDESTLKTIIDLIKNHEN